MTESSKPSPKDGDDSKVLCRTPTPDKQPKRIDQWKFDAVRTAILDVLKSSPELPFQDLPDRVGRALGSDDRANLGSLGWYTTTVKLELEVRGEIERVPDVTPQRLRLAET